ncbi:hypothetical protein RJG79_10770 [Mycoplasmatota bacterium WC44]
MRSLAWGFPDLLERTIAISMKSIDQENRKTLKDVKAKIDELLPDVLGEIYSALSKALNNIKEVELNGEYPRLADFSLYSVAILKEFNYTKEDFFKAFNECKDQLDQELLEYNPIVQLTYEYLYINESFYGSATELLEHFRDLAVDFGVDDKHSSFPKSASILSRRLNQNESVLNQYGISLYIGTDLEHGHRRCIKLYFDKDQKEVIDLCDLSL